MVVACLALVFSSFAELYEYGKAYPSEQGKLRILIQRSID